MDKKTISIWHPIDGQWRQITQVFSVDGGTVEYYTDGAETIPNIKPPNALLSVKKEMPEPLYETYKK